MSKEENKEKDIPFREEPNLGYNPMCQTVINNLLVGEFPKELFVDKEK